MVAYASQKFWFTVAPKPKLSEPSPNVHQAGHNGSTAKYVQRNVVPSNK
jgi:hypothetical protein